MAFEISPPNRETYVNTVAIERPPSNAPRGEGIGEPRRRSRRRAGPLKQGYAAEWRALSSASANQVADLNAYAAPRPEVTMDMSRVLRVDFAYTAVFFDVVKAIQLAGKRVVITGLNELNAALLEALGVNRYAILVRRKSN